MLPSEVDFPVIRQPVISQDEPVTLARCPACQGIGLYCIQRFLKPADRKELDRLLRLGYEAESKPLHSVGDVDDCNCSPATIARFKAKAAVQSKVPAKTSSSTRPVLSLKARRSPQE